MGPQDRKTTGLLTTGLLTTGHVTIELLTTGHVTIGLLDNLSFGQLWSFGQLVSCQKTGCLSVDLSKVKQWRAMQSYGMSGPFKTVLGCFGSTNSEVLS